MNYHKVQLSNHPTIIMNFRPRVRPKIPLHVKNNTGVFQLSSTKSGDINIAYYNQSCRGNGNTHGDSHRIPMGMGWEWEWKFHSHGNRDYNTTSIIRNVRDHAKTSG